MALNPKERGYLSHQLYKQFFLFVLYNIPESVERYFEISLQLDRNIWENSRRSSKFKIQYLNYLFESLIREPLIQLKLIVI